MTLGDDAGGGTYNEGRFTCRPDFVCVVMGATSDSSVLESPARMTSLSLPLPRLRFFGRLAPLVVLRERALATCFFGLDSVRFGEVTSVADATGCDCEAGGGMGTCPGASVGNGASGANDRWGDN